MDRKAIEVKLADITEAGTFKGYASIFSGKPDAYGDVIAPGAFRDTLAEHKARGTAPLMLWMHDPSEPIGRWDSVVEDRKGLKVEGRLVLETVRGKEAHALMKAGALDGLSIGYRAKAIERLPGGLRKLTKVDLAEVSLVSMPADAGARVTAVKANHQLEDMAMEDETEVLETEETNPMDDVVKRLDALATEVKAANDRADKLEVKLNRPGVIRTRTEEPGDLQRKAFNSFLRRGREVMEVDEIKALALSPDTAGGYLAHEQFVAEMLKNLVLFSPVRSVARVSPLGTTTALLPNRTGTLTAAWVGEAAAKASTEPTYGQLSVSVHEAGCYVDVSNQLLEDSEFDIAGELSRDFAEEFGRLEGVAFVNGTGSGQPAGFMQDGSIGGITAASNAAITADELIDLYHALPTAYAMRAVWGMNRTTMGAVRKLKDANGSYLWQEPISEGNPPTILGRPLVEMPDMADIGASAKPIIFGDFQAGYRIFDRLALSVLRDPYSVQVNGQVRFHARRRVGGAVTKAEAFKILTNAA